MIGSIVKCRRALDRLPAAREESDLDPVYRVRRYAEPQDQEVAGMIAALFAYGQVAMVCQTVGGILDQLGPSPREALLEGRHRRPRWCAGFKYRLNVRSDLIALLDGMAGMIREHGGLGLALSRHRERTGDFEAALTEWVRELRSRAAPGGQASRGLKHLLPDPSLGGACKRWRLYLRWMIRPADGLDLGTWQGLLDPSELVIPLDTHWIRIAPRLGLTSRRTPGGAMAREITAALRRLSPEDPLRFDYPVCHFGIRGGCPPRLTAADCADCRLRTVCPTGRDPNAAAAS